MQQEHGQEQALREDTGNQHPHRTLLERDKRLTKIDNMVWYRELLTTTDEVLLEMCTIDLNCLGLCPLFGGKEFQLTGKKNRNYVEKPDNLLPKELQAASCVLE